MICWIDIIISLGFLVKDKFIPEEQNIISEIIFASGILFGIAGFMSILFEDILSASYYYYWKIGFSIYLPLTFLINIYFKCIKDECGPYEILARTNLSIWSFVLFFYFLYLSYFWVRSLAKMRDMFEEVRLLQTIVAGTNDTGNLSDTFRNK